MMVKLGQRPFIVHHAQFFDQSVMKQAYEKEERKYLENVRRVQHKSAPRDANIISSQTVYKIKVEDNG